MKIAKAIRVQAFDDDKLKSIQWLCDAANAGVGKAENNYILKELVDIHTVDYTLGDTKIYGIAVYEIEILPAANNPIIVKPVAEEKTKGEGTKNG